MTVGQITTKTKSDTVRSIVNDFARVGVYDDDTLYLVSLPMKRNTFRSALPIIAATSNARPTLKRFGRLVSCL